MVIVARYVNPILGQICGLLVNRKWGINPTFLQCPLRFRLFFQHWEKFGESLVHLLENVPALQLSAIFSLSLHKISDTNDSTCLSHDQLEPAIETRKGIMPIGSFWKMGPWDDRLKQTRYRNTGSTRMNYQYESEDPHDGVNFLLFNDFLSFNCMQTSPVNRSNLIAKGYQSYAGTFWTWSLY